MTSDVVTVQQLADELERGARTGREVLRHTLDDLTSAHPPT
jgi:hypothetical protein